MFLVFQEGTFRLGVRFRGFMLAYQMDDPLAVFFASDPCFLQVQVEDDWSDDAPWTERQGGLSSQDLSSPLDRFNIFWVATLPNVTVC